METKNDIPAFYAKTRVEWRSWLEKNGASEMAVWLIIYHKKSETPSIYYPEAIEEALCFGWIDSKSIGRDSESSYLMFTPRKPASKWSGVNKERVVRLIENGSMTPAGEATIELAKKNGTWNALVDAENEVIPADLQELFDQNETAFKNFQSLPPSTKRQILSWISSAKRSETREKRLRETAAPPFVRLRGTVAVDIDLGESSG